MFNHLVGRAWDKGLLEVQRAKTRGASPRVLVKGLEGSQNVVRIDERNQASHSGPEAPKVWGMRSCWMFSNHFVQNSVGIQQSRTAEGLASFSISPLTAEPVTPRLLQSLFQDGCGNSTFALLPIWRNALPERAALAIEPAI